MTRIDPAAVAAMATVAVAAAGVHAGHRKPIAASTRRSANAKSGIVISGQGGSGVLMDIFAFRYQ
jgi:hypothetical protein